MIISPLSTSKKCAFCTSGVKLTPVMICILKSFLLTFHIINKEIDHPRNNETFKTNKK